MKKRRVLSHLLAAMLLLSAVSPDGVHAFQRIRLTTLAPRGHSFHRSLQRMGEAWRDASGGSIELIIYPGGILGDETAMVQRMLINQAQAALLTAIGLEEIDPAVTGLQYMPMVFRTLEELDYVAERLQPELEERLLAKGFVVLFWGDTGWVHFFSRDPVVHPEDLEKMKLWTTAGHLRTEEIYNEAGMNPVPLETSDILMGLQTGLIDAVPMPPFFALASQVYRPAPYMLALNWTPLVGALVIKKDVWDRIPDTVRGQLLAAARQAGAEIHEAGRREGDEAVETMMTRWNLQVHPVEPGGELEAEWRARAEATYPSIRGGIVPAEIFDEVQRLVQEYREASGRSH